LVTSADGRKGLRLAPDGRLAAYVSNESGRDEAYVRSFDPASGTAFSFITAAKKISTQGGIGMIRWNADGNELYFLASDGSVMVVSVASATSFGEQSPALLFPVPDNFPLAGAPGGFSDVSADGQRFVFALPAPPATGK
jgi:Tol biopolymer transport system component